MNAELSAAVGLAVGGGVALAATPLAKVTADRLQFYDHPRGYHKHGAPTPFLGGAAVVLGFLGAAVAVGALHGKLLLVLAGGLMMWLLGTLDDRFAVAPKWRVLAAGAMAVALYAVGLGWDTSTGGIVDLGVTVAWIVGLVNAFNLMDNLDGACGTVAVTVAAGVGVLAVNEGEAAVAGLALGLCGACGAFLCWNLSRPARIFLGDGGSMPVGFIAAALAMAASRHAPAGNAGLLVGALLVGLPILDVALVSVSRTRRGVSLMTGGRDHLTHRLLLALGSPRRVAAALAASQALLCASAVLGYELGAAGVIALAFIAFVAGATVLWLLDRPAWRPPGIAMGNPRTSEAQPPLAGLEAD